MNLIRDSWLPVVRKDGLREKIAIHQLLELYKTNPVMDVEAPRPDFRNALYQLLIGIVQVSAMPEDEEDWYNLFSTPYEATDFSKMVLKYEDCFEIDSEGPAFMQDLKLPEDKTRKEKPIYWMTMSSPGKNTIAENRDHFIKDNPNYKLDGHWAAVALFQLQTIGPPDGGGHREGLSGSGALYTILLPYYAKGNATFWEKIWFNVFPEENILSWNGNPKKPVFPWTIPTNVSTGDKKTYFDDLNALSVYWSFPRRIRLLFSKDSGECSLSGSHSYDLVKKFDTFKHGTLYHNTWKHPFVPYSKQDLDKNGKKKNSMRAIESNFIYTNWSNVALDNDHYVNSKVVSYYFMNRKKTLEKLNMGLTLWVSGFHMKSGEATVINWQEALWPIYGISSVDNNNVLSYLNDLTSEAIELNKTLALSIKKAWYKPKKNKQGVESWKDAVDSKKFNEYVSPIKSSFWQNTEPHFYSILDRLINNLEDSDVKNELVVQWGNILKNEAISLFDSNALAQQEDGLDMKRVVKARQGLEKGIAKMFKNLKV